MRLSLRGLVLLLAVALGLSACAEYHEQELSLSALDITRAPQSLSSTAQVTGGGFFFVVGVNLNDESTTVLNRFRVLVDEIELDSVTWQDSEHLQIVLPAQLPTGLHDLTVISPAGQAATLEQILLIDEPILYIEDAADGSGQALDNLELAIGNSVELFASARWTDGEFFRRETVTWANDGATGSFSASESAATFTANTSGTSTIVATSETFGIAELSVTSAICFSAADCSSANLCSMSNVCDAGVCVAGANDKDADGDGFVDINCGGSDCDDDPLACGSSCSPGLFESTSENTCSDGIDNDCDLNTDGADSSCLPGGGTPPIARIAVTPALGTTSTLFTSSGSASTDREQPASALHYDWDWDDDGVFEVIDSIGSTHTFATLGTHAVRMRVTDIEGLQDFAVFHVVVESQANLTTVTTEIDENSVFATPASPGGTGFSLREAIAWADATPGHQSILIPAGSSLLMDGSITGLNDAAGATIVGDGAFVDFANKDGISMNSGNQVYGLELANCGNTALTLSGGGNHLARLIIHDGKDGIENKAASANEIGPDIEIHDMTGIALRNKAPNTTLHHLYVHDCNVALELQNGANNSSLRHSRIAKNDVGLTIAGSSGVLVQHNTMHGNSTSGLALGVGVTTLDTRNNIFTGNSDFGISGSSAAFAQLDFNVFDGNGGVCSACTPGVNSQSIAPGYIDAAGADYRLAPTSSIIDTGSNLGIDVNGDGPGLFYGSAPDPGFSEAAY